MFWTALFFLITHRLAALLWFRWPAWRCNSCTVSDPALVNGMSPEPLIPTGVLAVGQNAGHELLATTDGCDIAGSRLGHGAIGGLGGGRGLGTGCFSGLALLRRGWRHRRAWWRAWHGYGGCLSGLALQHLSDLALVNGMSPEPLIPTGVLAVGQNAGHQVLVKVLCGWRGTTGHFEWQQARQPRAVFAGSNANKLNRLGAAFSCIVSDSALWSACVRLH